MITILLVEDYPFILHSLKGVLEKEPDFSIVADAASAVKTLELVRDLQPDVVVLDLELTEGKGLVLAKNIHQASSQSRIIVFSLTDYAPYIDLFSTAGVSKFISKLDPIDDLIHAIRFP